MVAVEDVPGLDFDGDDEVVEEGEGEVESGRVCVSSTARGTGSGAGRTL